MEKEVLSQMKISIPKSQANFLRHNFAKIIRLSVPYGKELYPGSDASRIAQEFSSLLIHLIKSVEEENPGYFFSALHRAFMEWISKGVYLDRVEQIFRKIFQRLEEEFKEELAGLIMAFPERREIFFQIVREYTNAFREFSERQLKELEILNLLGDFTKEDLKRLFRKIFRKTLRALNAQYGVLYYHENSLEILQKKLVEGSAFPFSKLELRRFLKDTAYDPKVLQAFYRILQKEEVRSLTRSLETDMRKLLHQECSVCSGEPVLVTRYTGVFECPLIQTLKVGSLMCVPFYRNGERRGFFLLTRPGGLAFNPYDLQFLKVLVNDVARGMENYILYSELRRLATTDALTGIYNRRYLIEAMRREHERSKRYQKSYALVMADLDHFKEVNDQYGHAAGDEALKVFGRILKNYSRITDVVGRYGGEEFLVIIPEGTMTSSAAFAERIRKTLEQTVITSPVGVRFRITASFGVCSYPHHGKTPEKLLKKVDDFLYQAKKRGRNRVEVAS